MESLETLPPVVSRVAHQAVERGLKDEDNHGHTTKQPQHLEDAKSSRSRVIFAHACGARRESLAMPTAESSRKDGGTRHRARSHGGQTQVADSCGQSRQTSFVCAFGWPVFLFGCRRPSPSMYTCHRTTRSRPMSSCAKMSSCRQMPIPLDVYAAICVPKGVRSSRESQQPNYPGGGGMRSLQGASQYLGAFSESAGFLRVGKVESKTQLGLEFGTATLARARGRQGVTWSYTGGHGKHPLAVILVDEAITVASGIQAGSKIKALKLSYRPMGPAALQQAAWLTGCPWHLSQQGK